MRGNEQQALTRRYEENEAFQIPMRGNEFCGGYGRAS